MADADTPVLYSFPLSANAYRSGCCSDIGLFRYQVGTELAEEAARARSRRQINWMHRGSAGEGDGCAGK